MNGLLLFLLAVSLMGGGYLLWQSVQEPEETEPPYDWSADWHLMLQMESETVDALISVRAAEYVVAVGTDHDGSVIYETHNNPDGPVVAVRHPKTWSQLNEEEMWQT